MLKIRILLFAVIVFLFNYTSIAQSTKGGLLVIAEKREKLPSYLNQVQSGTSDTSQARLLIKIANILWYKRHGSQPSLDSCYSFSKRAFDMSAGLKFIEGLNEAGLVRCKASLERDDISDVNFVLSRTYGEQRVRLLLILAEYYTFKFELVERKFKLAFPLILEAQFLSSKIKSDEWLDQSLLLLTKYHFKNGDPNAGKKAALTIISKYEKLKNYALAAHYWSELGIYTPPNNDNYRDIIKCHEKAVHYYLLASNKKSAAYSLRDLALIYGNHNRLDSAENQLKRCLALLKSISEKPSLNTYQIVGDFYRFTGQYEKALIYALEGLKNAKSDQDKINLYFLIATIYELRKDYQKSLHYYNMVFNDELRYETGFMYTCAYKITNVITASGDPKKALKFLTNFLRDHPPVLLNRKQLFCHSFINIYTKLLDYRNGEKYCREMLNLNEAVNKENSRHDNNGTTLAGCGAYFLAGQFYTDWKKFSQGGYYLKKSLEDPQYFDYQQELDTYRLLAKTDSASGNFKDAFKHLQKFKLLNDSVSNIGASRRISELSIRFETEQRLKDIRLLQNKQRIQEANLQRAAILRNLTIGCAILFLILTVIFFLALKKRQRVNRELRLQRDEIDNKNAKMQLLLIENEAFLKEKDQHLKEKDWLLKEIHHRVKNNLQIVISLLNSQSKYLKDPDTLSALQGSQNRIFSISLIHQKLYQHDNVSGISFPTYIKELTSYLSSSLDAGEKIQFVIAADDVLLDVSQAVPIGLIANEAITNAMKHAFTGLDKGLITITLAREKNDWLSLKITDDGNGLPEDLSIDNADTLGMTLMKGLSEQLNAEFTFNRWPSVSLHIRWRQSRLEKPISRTNS